MIRASRSAVRRIKVDVADSRAGENRGSHLGNRFGQIVFQSSAIDLVTGSREKSAAANFRAFGQRLASVFEEKTKSKLWQLLIRQMLFQLQFLAKIMSPNLDRRLADFVGRFGNRKAPFLNHGDSSLWPLHQQLFCQRQSSQTAAENGHIVFVI